MSDGPHVSNEPPVETVPSWVPERSLFNHLDQVQRDVACHGCGYNLRGLSANGRCPECAAPTMVSLAGDALHFAEPRWVKQVSRGANLTVQAAIIGLVISVLLPRVLGSIQLGTVMGLLGGTIALLVFVRGLWLFSTPNPAESDTGFWGDARSRVRGALIAVVATTVVTIAVPHLPAGPFAWVWVQLIGAPFGACGLIGALGMCAYGKEIARRIGNKFLFARTNAYRKGYLACWSLLVVGIIAHLLTGFPLIACTYFVAGPGVLAFGALILLLPTMLAKELEAHRQLAEKIWQDAMHRRT